MNYVEQQIVLKTDSTYGADVPLTVSSPLLRRLEALTRPSIRMAFEGTSTSAGAPPSWLELASDVRTLGFGANNNETVLHLKAPRLGEAAPRLFEQRSLWPSPTSPDDTALQVIAKVARAVRNREMGSDLYDRALLRHLATWKRLFQHELNSVEFRPKTTHPRSQRSMQR